MISIYQLKSRFQKVLRPFVCRLAGAGVTANQVTVFACILSVGIGVYFHVGKPETAVYWLIPVFLFVRMALNAIDGLLAREHNMQSPLGAILNELTDVIADAFFYYPLAFNWGLNQHLNVLFVFMATLTEMTGVIGVQIGASRRYDGPLGKSDRAFVFSLLAILFALGVSLQSWINSFFVVLLVLLALTVWRRAVQAMRQITS